MTEKVVVDAVAKTAKTINATFALTYLEAILRFLFSSAAGDSVTYLFETFILLFVSIMLKF